MPYAETTWVDGGAPSISAAKLNNIEDAIVSLRDFPTAGGTANAITVTAYHFSLTAGASLTFIAAADNTAATTLNVNGLGAKNFYKPGTTDKPYIKSGEAITAWYDGTSFFHKAAKTANSIVILAFNGSNQVSEIDISSLAEIYPYMFKVGTEGIYNLEFVVLPSELTKIGLHAFYGNTLMECETVALPNTIAVIDDWAFFNCEKVAFTSLPSGLTEIHDHVFAGCDALAITKIPDGVVTIDQLAFNGCVGLTRIWIPDSCTTIIAANVFKSPFLNCSSTLAVYCEAASKPAGWTEFWDNYSTTEKLSVTWGVTEVAYDAL